MAAPSKRAIRNSERDIYIKPSGEQFLLGASRSRQVLSDEGTGMPPLDMVTQRGPYQDGVTLKNIYLEPRILQYHIRQRACTRREYWTVRNTLLDLLAPANNGAQGTLRKILTDGTTRDINVVIQQGPTFNPRRAGVWDEWAIDEVLRFFAVDPTYFDPTLHTVVWDHTTVICEPFPYTFPFYFCTDPGLIFPITFPITFGGFLTGNGDYQFTYSGTWNSYPTIQVLGPLDWIRITNVTTDEELFINYPLASGESYTIELTYNSKSVSLDADGTNIIGYVGSQSDLGTFHLAPGVNSIRIQVGGAGSATTVTMTYYERFIGI